MPSQKSLSDLDLGIRELFRIAVPGAYAVLLILILAPDSSLSKFAARNAGLGIGASFFLGLLGYALRPHERWAPYFLHFEQFRSRLNTEIERVASPEEIRNAETGIADGEKYTWQPDHVALYKLFLEAKADDVKERIHYFSSFYYMLVEVSLFSLIAAFWITADHALLLARILGHHQVANIATAMICGGILVQVSLLCGLQGVRTQRSKAALASSLILWASAVLLPTLVCWGDNLRLLRCAWDPDPIPITLLFAAFAFERLGSKQWKQIIEEQVVLVNSRAEALREMGKRWQSK